MRWLKTLVIGMGAAIVIGLTVVIVVVAQRAGEPSEAAAQRSPLPMPPVIGMPVPGVAAKPTGAIGDIGIDIPPGATVVDTVADPARLTIRLQLSDGRTALLLIDAVTGEKLGLITLDDRPASR